MRTKHQRILKAIYQRPISTNLTWHEVKSLLEALGVEIVEGAGSRVTLVYGERRAHIHVPHPKPELLIGHIKDLQRFLHSIGVEQ